jgi:hypothetical protein
MTAISGLVLAFMLAIAPPAEATCAWVLWATPPDLSQYYPMGGYDTRDKCDLRAKEENKKQLALRSSHWPTGIPAAHLCLPDTIDPRGPKGGGR